MKGKSFPPSMLKVGMKCFILSCDSPIYEDHISDVTLSAEKTLFDDGRRVEVIFITLGI